MRAAHDPRYLELVARLRQARQAHHLTQAQLALLLGKTQSYVSKVETCERRIDAIETAEWCAHLQVQLEDVLPKELQLGFTSRTRSGESTK